MAIWRLYLRDILGIHHITIHYRTDNMEWGPNNENVGKFLGFSVYVSNLTLLEDRVLCFHDFHFDKYTIPAGHQTENNPLSAYVGGFVGCLSLVVIIAAVVLLYRRQTIERGVLRSPKPKLRNGSSCRSYETLELDTSTLQEETRLARTDLDQTEVKRHVTTGKVYEKLQVKNSIGDMGTYQQLLLDIPITEIGSIITEMQRDNAEGFIRDYAGAERNNEYIAAQVAALIFSKIVSERFCNCLHHSGYVKCYKYWPNNGKTEIYGTVSVEFIEEKVYVFFTKRIFNVSQLGMKSYVVTQFHYTTWPDHETPDPLCLVIFHNHVANETVPQGVSPTLVHCSTGTGRTGTYIALDYLYKTGKMSGSVNVAEYVKTMRENRMNMVETFNQYVAVFLALQEAFQAQPALQSKKQFLNKVTSLMKKGNMISTWLKQEHETYTKDNGFIITQYPSHDNVVEFIRLIVDYECRTVICLDLLHHIKSSKAWMPSPSSEMVVSPYRVVCNTCKETDLKVSTLIVHKEKEEPFCVTVAEPKYEFGSKLQNDVTCLCNLVSFALNRPRNSPIAVISM
uniref:Receptor-type tyrosine-protein phosphatase kappa n=1 Tax=Magallana gigas TaxID=29159 RepID=K1QRA3_MAGGI